MYINASYDKSFLTSVASLSRSWKSALPPISNSCLTSLKNFVSWLDRASTIWFSDMSANSHDINDKYTIIYYIGTVKDKGTVCTTGD